MFCFLIGPFVVGGGIANRGDEADEGPGPLAAYAVAGTEPEDPSISDST